MNSSIVLDEWKPSTVCTNKNNPLGKIQYLSYCDRFHQVYSFYRGGFRHIFSKFCYNICCGL